MVRRKLSSSFFFRETKASPGVMSAGYVTRKRFQNESLKSLMPLTSITMSCWTLCGEVMASQTCHNRVPCKPGSSIAVWPTGILAFATNSAMRNWHRKSSKEASPSDSTMYSTKLSATSSAIWSLVKMARASAEMATGESMARPLYILKQDVAKGGSARVAKATEHEQAAEGYLLTHSRTHKHRDDGQHTALHMSHASM